MKLPIVQLFPDVFTITVTWLVTVVMPVADKMNVVVDESAPVEILPLVATVPIEGEIDALVQFEVDHVSVDELN